MKKIKSQKHFVYSLYLLAFILPWNFHWSIFSVGLVYLMFLILIFRTKKTYQFKANNTIYILSFLLILYFILHLIGLLYSSNIPNGLQKISLKIHIIFLPLVLFYTSKIIYPYLKTILNLFVISSFLATITLLVIAFYNSISIENGHILFQASVRAGFGFWNSAFWPGNYFFYNFFSNFNHPSYYSLLVLISISILLFQNELNITNYTKTDKIFSITWVNLLLALYFIFIIYLLSSKANLIALIGLLFIYFINLKIKFVFKSGLIFVFFIFIVLFFQNPRFEGFVSALKKEVINKSNKNHSGTQRFFYWEKGMNICSENLFFGVGTGDVEDEIYKIDHNNYTKKHNLHNEFFENFVRFGLLGGIVFLSIFLILFYISLKNRNILLFALIFIFATNFFFESMLNRISGTIYFGFFIFMPLFLKNKRLK